MEGYKLKKILLIFSIVISITLVGCSKTISKEKDSKEEKSYNGNTENLDLEDIEEEKDDYLFPSDKEYIESSDIEGKSKEDLAFMRNEILARHGYIFKDNKYRDYFESKSWYKEDKNFSENILNAIEKKNIEFLKKVENPNISDNKEITLDEASKIARYFMYDNIEGSCYIYDEFKGKDGWIFSVTYPDEPEADDDAIQVYSNGKVGWSTEVD